MAAIIATYSQRKPDRNKVEDGDLAAVKTLSKALAVLDVFAVAERPLTVAEVAIRASITRPTAYRLVQTLIADGYLAQDPADGRIMPGYSVLMLASNLLDTNRIRLEALPHLETLARTTGERVSLGILHRHEMLYLAGVEKPSLPTIYTRFGKAVPAYCSAIGKSILAHLSEADLAEYLANVKLLARTPTTLTEESALRSELAEIRRTGIAYDRGENSPLVSCVGAAILVNENPVAALAVLGRMLEPLRKHEAVVRHTAEIIAHVLGRGV